MSQNNPPVFSETEYVRLFGEIFVKQAMAMFGLDLEILPAPFIGAGTDGVAWIHGDYDTVITLPFSGEVFGDHLVCLRRPDWESLFSAQYGSEVPFESCIQEFMNTVAAKSISHMIHYFPNVDSLPPKICGGTVGYSQASFSFLSFSDSSGRKVHAGVYFDSAASKMKERLAEVTTQHQQITDIMARLKTTQQELQHAAHSEGMAEIAASVLHNLGNQMNTVNIAASELSQIEDQSVVDFLRRLADHVRADPTPFADHSSQEAKGSKLFDAVHLIHTKLREEATRRHRVLGSLKEKMDHIESSLQAIRSYIHPPAIESPIMLRAIIEEVVAYLEEDIKAARAEIVLQLGAIPNVLLTRHRVLNILVNLIRNACEAVSENQGRRRITISTEIVGERIIVRVTDTGAGIDTGNLQRIFSQGGKGRTGKRGFGLDVSANAATDMGGRIEATSAGPGQGATFTLILPCRLAAA